MILIIALSVFLGTGLLVWIVTPLLQNLDQADGGSVASGILLPPIEQPFAQNTPVLKVRDDELSEENLKESLTLRDMLLSELLGNKGQLLPEEDNQKPGTQEQRLTEDDKLERLVDICLTLKKHGLPYLAILFISLNGAWLTPEIYAQNLVEASPQAQLDIRIPTGAPVSSDPNNKQVIPRVNQFILYPSQGKLVVQYFALMQPSQTPTHDILLPLPTLSQALEVTQPAGALVKSSPGFDAPVLTVSSSGGLIQIRAQFEIPASDGVVHWRGSQGLHLPGMSLIVMPEYDGLLRTILESSLPHINIWPARILGIPVGFERERVFEIFNPDHPVVKQLSNPPKQKMIRFLRAGSTQNEYPIFEVTGLVPDRQYLNGLGVFFGSLLLGILLFFNFILPLTKQKKTNSSTP